MWVTIGLAVVLVAVSVFLAYLALDRNNERVYQNLIGSAVICGTVGIVTLALVVVVMLTGFTKF
jgi:hypothetical protein